MKQSTMEAYAEVDTILSLMDTKYITEIPNQLREMFKSKKSTEHNKKIVANKPLKEQNLNPETLEILAVLNYNYWCKDENKKMELLKLYNQNDLKKEQERREKYNPDDLFKNTTTITTEKQEKNTTQEISSEETAMIEIEKKGFLGKILEFIKKIFNK